MFLKYLGDLCVTFKFSSYRWNCTRDVTEPAIKTQMNKHQPCERKVFYSSCKKFSGCSDNKIHGPHDSASRYFKFYLILAVEERHQTDIWGACRQGLGVYTFPPCPTYRPNLALGRPTLEIHVLFSQFTRILAFPDPAEYGLIYQREKKTHPKTQNRKKDGSFSDVYTFSCEN